MSRTLKRVPQDFSWPLHKVWGGYLNPFYAQSTKCAACSGTGYSPEARRFHDQWYGNASFDPVAYGVRLLTVDHPYIQAFARRQCERHPDYYGSGERAIQREAARLHALWVNQWKHNLNRHDVEALLAAGELHAFDHVPTVDEVNDWSLAQSIGGPSQYVCATERCKREGVEMNCPACGGECDVWPSPTIKQQYDDWKEEDPPIGDGYQLWEDCSEGSPVSPVFAALDALCAWAEENATTFGPYKATKEEWREMLDGGIVHASAGGNVFL